MAGCPEGGGTFSSEGNIKATLMLMNAHGQGKTKSLNRADSNKCVTPSSNKTIATEAMIFYHLNGQPPPGVSIKQKNLYAMVSMLTTVKFRRRNSRSVITFTQRRLEYFRLSHGKSVPDQKGAIALLEEFCEIVEWHSSGVIMLAQADIGDNDEYPGWVDGGGSYDVEDPDRPDESRSGNLVQRYHEGVLFLPVPGYAGNYDIMTSVEHCSEIGVPYRLDLVPLPPYPPGTIPRGRGVSSGGGSGEHRDEKPDFVVGQKLNVLGGALAFLPKSVLSPVNWTRGMPSAVPGVIQGQGQAGPPDYAHVMPVTPANGSVEGVVSAESRGNEVTRRESQPGTGNPWPI